MAEVEELLDEITVRMPSGAQLRARGDRRLARRRATAVAAAVVAVAGAVTWAVLPGNGPAEETRPAKAPTATASPSSELGDTPYKKNGVVDLLAAKKLPLYGQWHWQRDDESDDALSMGSLGDCAAVEQVLKTSSGPWRYSTAYHGDRGARAGHDYTEYDAGQDGTAALATALSSLREAASGCGATSHVTTTGAGGRTVDTYTGTGENNRQLRIVVEHGPRWLSVVEEYGGAPRA
ncbi:hypothetical protein [Streptomyces sp. R35]|uniref:Uncharacterized protein n=1 Tax=Streptomyces sp. R35 TaxID=3238630 RepID=A0AB39SFY5_9ACTN